MSQYFNGLVQDCSNSIANELQIDGLLQSWTKPSICWLETAIFIARITTKIINIDVKIYNNIDMKIYNLISYSQGQESNL